MAVASAKEEYVEIEVVVVVEMVVFEVLIRSAVVVVIVVYFGIQVLSMVLY